MGEAVATLRPKQRTAVQALVVGHTHQEAADQAGVSLRTLQRWRAKPEFAAALQAADAENLTELARLVSAASKKALSVMFTIMNDPKMSAGLRLRAASEILRHRREFYEQLNLSDRLAALEERLSAPMVQPERIKSNGKH